MQSTTTKWRSTLKILTFDIETSPHISAHFGRWKQNIPPEHTLHESDVICYAAKWHDKKQVIFRSLWDRGRELLAEEIWDLLDEADVVVSYNGKKFDIKRLNTMFLEDRMGPPSPFQHVDLFTQAKKHFNFSSNKLKHVLKRLGLTPKLEDDVKMQLWIDACWHSDPRAQGIMKKYNIQDVKSTEELYNYMLGWIDPHPNWGLFINDEDDNPICPNCGSKELIKKGVEHTKVRTYQRWKCKDCGSHHRGRRNIGKPGVENGILA
jgi:DNA polymerase elongation subunit (family B)/DNA-directed RNA polymerase subunit RPC12/RpoP